jgi:hypothetical protein
MGSDPTETWIVGDGPWVPVSGAAFTFGPTSGRDLRGARIVVAEDPSIFTTLEADNRFYLEVPSGAPLSFRLEQPGFFPNQTATLDPGAEGLSLVGFQAPIEEMAEALAAGAGVVMNPERCQVATTVSAASSEPYGGSGMGEPGVIVELLPELPAGASGPVYFAYYSEAVIYPDPSLRATSIDGGVLFANLPPGEYRLRAEKEGIEFTEVELRCRAGTLVNAAPPHGIQVLTP